MKLLLQSGVYGRLILLYCPYDCSVCWWVWSGHDLIRYLRFCEEKRQTTSTYGRPAQKNGIMSPSLGERELLDTICAEIFRSPTSYRLDHLDPEVSIIMPLYAMIISCVL